MLVELDVNELSGVIGCLTRRLCLLEENYCRFVNSENASYYSALIVRYLRLIRKFEPTFELLTGSTSLLDILKREVYDA